MNINNKRIAATPRSKYANYFSVNGSSISAGGGGSSVDLSNYLKLTGADTQTVEGSVSATGDLVAYTLDPSTDIQLPIASTTALGMIKVGNNLTITEDGTLNAEAGGGGLASVTVNLGSVGYDSVNGVVSLPAYPTSLPADGGNADSLGNVVAANYWHNGNSGTASYDWVCRSLLSSVGFSAYTPDGLFSGNARPSKFSTPGTGSHTAIGYRDYGDGQYCPRLGFSQDASVNPNLTTAKISIGLNHYGNFVISPNNETEHLIWTGMNAGASAYDWACKNLNASGHVMCNNWFRSNGVTGWYNETYGGGIYMADSNYVRVYGDKGFVSSGLLVAQNGIRIETESGMWISGKTSAKCLYTQPQTIGGFRPLAKLQSLNDGALAFGGLGDDMGLWGYQNGRTVNDTDAQFTWNSSTQVWTLRQHLFVKGNITADGEVTAYSTSDKRLKSNVTSITNALDVIDKLNPVSYTWNEKAVELNSHKDTETNNFGLIAQELETVLPELVHPIHEEYKGVDYIQLIPILIKAVQELKQSNEDLQQQIKTLIN